MNLVRPVFACSISVVFLLMASVLVGDEGDADPKIVTPFDSQQMPTAIALLGDCMKQLDQSDRWAADVTLSTDGHRFTGPMTRAGDVLAGEVAEADSGRRLRFRLDLDQAVSWMSQDASTAELEALTRLARAVNLLSFVTRLPGEDASDADYGGAFKAKNLGVTDVAGDRCYVVELTANADSQPSGQLAGGGVQRALILVSVEDTIPRSITAETGAGAGQQLSLTSLKLGANLSPPGDQRPPAEAVVIELLASDGDAGDDTLKNPIPYNAESIARGERLYRADCVVCHSDDGTGRNSDVTDNAADLTSTEYWLSDGSEEATFLAIRDGAGDEMPGYIDEYGDENMIWDLVNYLRKLQGK